tara:strand:+ start:678 stop:1331 length:654 start_codon:yes stop_codon:yes gene_type:complete
MANIRNIDYGGFDHATGSAATGSGFMIWSGSMQLRKSLAYASQTTQYYGVGIEAIAHSGSYFRFQTDTDGNQTSSLDIRTDKFFVGNAQQFISASNGNIEISSSNFHVNPGGLVTAANFSEKIVTVTNGNKALYFQDDSTTGVKLVLDGSQGGALAMNLQLNVAPYNTAASATKPISDILFPLQGAGELARATIIINVGGVTFEEDDVATGIADMSK